MRTRVLPGCCVFHALARRVRYIEIPPLGSVIPRAMHATALDAIAEAGYSPALLSRLTTAEAEVVRVDREIAAYKPLDLAASVEEIQQFVTTNVMQLRSLLRQDAPTAKAALMKHIKRLVLTPDDRPPGPVFKVSGGIDLPVFECNAGGGQGRNCTALRGPGDPVCGGLSEPCL